MLLVVLAIVTYSTPSSVITALLKPSTQTFDSLQQSDARKQFLFLFENSMTIKQQQRIAQLAPYPYISTRVAFPLYAMCVV